MPSGGEITRLLTAIRLGDPNAESVLVELVYENLRARAKQHMRSERPDHTLQPTALVHEAYLRLMQDQQVEWQNRAHFFAAASRVMRRILVDHARGRGAAKRVGTRRKVELTDTGASGDTRVEDLLIIDELLDRLTNMDPRQARIVELMYFGGLTEAEAAAVLQVSVRTVKRDWHSARAWLQAELARVTK